jgi:2-iminobutanoate/2-iminopropanoate deaminase
MTSLTVLPEPTPLLREQTAPLSSIVQAAGLLWLSGLTPRDVNTGNRELGDIEQQTVIVMENIRVLLEHAGRSFSDVVRTTIYLTDTSDFEKMNEVYKRYFSQPYPARSTVTVAGLVHPKYRIEIDVVATAAGR